MTIAASMPSPVEPLSASACVKSPTRNESMAQLAYLLVSDVRYSAVLHKQKPIHRILLAVCIHCGWRSEILSLFLEGSSTRPIQ